jgi:hypothetical protein
MALSSFAISLLGYQPPGSSTRTARYGPAGSPRRLSTAHTSQTAASSRSAALAARCDQFRSDAPAVPPLPSERDTADTMLAVKYASLSNVISGDHCRTAYDCAYRMGFRLLYDRCLELRSTILCCPHNLPLLCNPAFRPCRDSRVVALSPRALVQVDIKWPCYSVILRKS